MKRKVILSTLLFVCLTAGQIASGQSGPKTDEKKTCPFSIAGLWRSDATSENTPVFFSFSPEGAVLLMGHDAEALPQDFEILTTVSYKLDNPEAPRRIEFVADRGNDFFLKGTTSLDITEYDQGSFTTINPASGKQTRWTREQTHRYFLTFAARGGQTQQAGPAFVMWTALDGRKNEIHALGVHIIADQQGKPQPVFGPIPAELYERLAEERDRDKKIGKDETIIMRFELTGAEFEKSHKTFEVWDKYVKARALPHEDPYLNGMEFIKSAVGNLNPCREKIKLHKPTPTATAEIAAQFAPPRRALEYVRVMRKQNAEMHVTDGDCPWGWRPAVQLPGQ
jgi:hypothetical protein